MAVALCVGLCAASLTSEAAVFVRNIASATYSQSGAAGVRSNEVTVEVLVAPQFAVTTTSSVAQAAPGQDIRFSVNTTSGLAPPGATSSAYLLDGVPSTQAYVLAPVPAGATLTSNAAATVFHWAGTPSNQLHTAMPPSGGTVDGLGILLAAVPAQGSAVFSFTVVGANNAQAYSGGTTLSVAPVVNAGPGVVQMSAPAVARIVGVPATLSLFSDKAETVPTSALYLGHPGFAQVNAPACNDNLGTAVTRIGTLTTNGGDSEQVLVTQTAANSSIFQVAPITTQRGAAVPHDSVLEAPSGATASLSIAGCYTPVSMAFPLIDPQGVVFDSTSNDPVDGLTVTLLQASAGACTQSLASAQTWDANGALIPAPNPYVSQSSGRYEFPLVAPGSYCLKVTQTPQYSFPTSVPLANLSQDRRLQAGSLGKPFQLGPNAAPVLLDLPVDATSTQATLFVDKKASQSTIVVGEQLDFTVSVKNTSAKTVGHVQLKDFMSQGMAYIGGTARVDGQKTGEPVLSAGALTFPLPDLASGASTTVTYRAGVGPTAGQVARNSASAVAPGATSNVSSVKVDVVRGFETDSKGVLTGTVYLECNHDDVDASPGLPGVKLLLEDGTSVTTDKFGRFSLYGLRAATHVVKLDASTFPEGAKLVERDARGLAMVDLKDGELFKRNFGFVCTPALQEQARMRASLLQHDEVFKVLDRTFTPTAIAPVTVGVNVTASSADAATGLAPAQGAVVARPMTPNASVLNPAVDGLHGAGGASVKPALTLEEALVAASDNKAQFLNLQDGQILPGSSVFVRVKAPAESQLELLVNDVPVGSKQIGQRSVYPDKAMMGLEFVGVQLKAGENILRLVQKDQFGNLRGSAQVQVQAPGELAQILVGATGAGPLYAGEGSQTLVRVRALDARGLPVTARLPVTLVTDTGRWLLPNGSSAATVEVFVDGGYADVAITQPAQANRVSIMATSGTVHSSSTLDFVPMLRPMIAAGVLEGIVRVRSGQGISLFPTSSLDAFSQELKGLSRELGSKSEIGGRSAVYLKGKVKGDYLLTLAYDSDKTNTQRLFRDISPDEFYPVYGDSSTRGFDAQSTSKLYVRIEREHNWLLVGDFNTQPMPAKGQRAVLSAYSRPVNGAAGHLENDRYAVDGFVMRDSSTQKVYEFSPNGTSGPYALPATNLLANTERVELLTRDKLNNQVVLKSIVLSRFNDYELEPLAGRLLFNAPVSAFDADQNPQTVRVTFEVESSAAAFTTAGGQVTAQVTSTTTVGVRAAHEANPASPYTVGGVLAETQLTPTMKLSGELARTMRTGENATSGSAERLEARGTVGRAEIAATATATSQGYENASSAVMAGRRDLIAAAAYPLTDTTKLAAKVTAGQDTKTGSEQATAYAGVDTTVAKGVQLEAGVRELRDTSPVGTPAAPGVPGAEPVQATTVRLKISTQLDRLPELTASVETEQAVVGTGREVAVAANYQLAPGTKVYGRHELVNTLPVLSTASTGRQATAVGIESAYSATGTVHGELRESVNQGVSGPGAAYGVKESWQAWKGVLFAGGIERVQSLGGPQDAVPPSVALTSSVKINLSPDWRANARAERAISATERSTLLTSGVAYKLSDDWTFLGRQTRFDSVASTSGLESVRSRVQLGAAWRSGKDDALLVAETRKDPTDGADTDSDVVSLQYGRALTTSLRASVRIAGRSSRLRSLGLDTTSSAALIGGRLSFDVNSKWSLGLQTQEIAGTGLRGPALGVGAEVGYRFTDVLWVVVGYDLMQARDPILQGDVPRKGAYVRLRYMFDEQALAVPQ